jgi:photosystem II stability/assembly factor-like uncharacterized protein
VGRSALLVALVLVASAFAGGSGPKRFEPAAVSFVSPSHGWLLGRFGCDDCAALRETRDGGAHWSVLPLRGVRLSPYAPGVSDVRFADARNGFLTGSQLLATHDGGHTWERLDLRPAELLVGRSWAFALSTKAFWRSRLGSDHWLRLPLPPHRADTRLRLAVAPGVVVLLDQGDSGPGLTRATLGRVWLSRDGGATWRAQTNPCTLADGGATVLGIALGRPDVWLLDCYDGLQSSQEQHTRHHLYGTTDAGQTWRRLGDPSHHDGPALLADNGRGHAFLAAEGGTDDVLYGSYDRGRHWRFLFASPGGFGWADLAFVTPGVGFVVAPTHYAPEHLYRTDDGGRHWRIVRIG